MESQSGARSTLVDPFGRELEDWLRDAPATTAPYVADLLVPPVTGPVTRPAVVDPDGSTTAEPETEPAESVAAEPVALEPADTDPEVTAPASFRRDRARHASVCAPSFPEPPERLALRFDDLAIEVSAASGRTTIERIVFLESELRRRDDDLERLRAWESEIDGTDDPEAIAAREYARSVFADLLAEAAAERAAVERDDARRAARAVAAAGAVDHEPDDGAVVLPVIDARPVSASTRPTPLVQPATGPNAIDAQAFAAALRSHTGDTAATPVVLPEEHRPERAPDAQVASAAPVASGDGLEAPPARPWWRRVVDGLLRALGRR